MAPKCVLTFTVIKIFLVMKNDGKARRSNKARPTFLYSTEWRGGVVAAPFGGIEAPQTTSGISGLCLTRGASLQPLALLFSGYSHK